MFSAQQVQEKEVLKDEEPFDWRDGREPREDKGIFLDFRKKTEPEYARRHFPVPSPIVISIKEMCNVWRGLRTRLNRCCNDAILSTLRRYLLKRSGVCWQRAEDYGPVEILSHWHPNLTINLVDDHTSWVKGSVPPPLDQCEFVMILCEIERVVCLA